MCIIYYIILFLSESSIIFYCNIWLCDSSVMCDIILNPDPRSQNKIKKKLKIIQVHHFNSNNNRVRKINTTNFDGSVKQEV